MELLDRARYGDLDGVKRLIQEQHLHVNTTNRCNQTALYLACENGHTKVAQYLLDSGASVSLGAKPLIAAVRYDHYDCVKLLLEYRAHVNCTNTKLESPMSVAVQKRHYSIILLLVQYNAIPSESLRDIAIHLLKHAKLEHATAIQKLIEKNLIDLASENTFLAAFGYAFKRGSVELADRMLSNDSYAKIDQLYPDAAYYSAKNNWPTVLSKLVEEKGVDINALTDGQTPLYAACKEGHESVVKLLLNKGADPNIPNKLTTSTDLSSALQIAVSRGNAMTVELLLEKGAKLQPPGEPLLHIACSDKWKTADAAGDTQRVEHMLSMISLLLQHGMNVNVISDKGDTALYRACVSQQLEIVQVLLEAGANVNLTSKAYCPLIAACEAGNAELINLLVKAGADVKCRNISDETCLHAAIKAYSATLGSPKPADSVSVVDIIKSLLEAGVDVNACSSLEETALYRASEAGHEHIVRLLLEAGAETIGSIRSRPLYAACERGHTQIVDLLLHHGADLNASSTSPRRHNYEAIAFLSLRIGLPVRAPSSESLPICCAIEKGHTDIVSLLLKQGADVNKRDQSGKSAFMTFLELMISRRSKTLPPVSNPSQERDFNILKSMLLAGGDVNMLSGSSGHSALHVASSSGMCDVMMEMIQHGANCNQLTSSGKSALDLACENGHEAAVELLLKNGANPDRRTSTTNSDRSGHSRYDSYQSAKPGLCTAAKNGSETMVKMLLEHGANVNEVDNQRNTALHLATSNVIIRTLLDAGANVNASNNNGETALSIVYEKQKADANVVEMLLKVGANPNTCFLLHTACKNNDLETVGLLLAHGADANLVKESMSKQLLMGGMWGFARRTPVQHIEPSPLCIACKNGNKAIVDCLLTKGAAVAFADSEGNTPLHFAVGRLGEQANSQEYDPIVTVLLTHNAPVNVVSSRGETPLYAACTKGLAGVVKQLLDCRADVGLTTMECKKYPLMIACERKFTEIAMMLIDRGAEANVCEDQQTPLKLAAANGDAVLVKRLLDCGADVNQMRRISDSALHVAVVPRKGLRNEAFVNIVQSLLKSGAEPNAHNRNAETPLYLACRPTTNDVNIDIVQTLLEHGADPNTCPPRVSPWSCDSSPPPLTVAAICGNSGLATLLIKFGARVNHSDDQGKTALHFAVGYDHMRYTLNIESTKSRLNTSTAEKLLSAGANVNAIDTDGASPLYLACDKGKTELVKLLLSRGANPNVGTVKTYPIHAACKGRYYDAVKLLLEYNADVAVGNKSGKTALHLALESETRHSTDSDNGTALVQLLLDRGADVNAASEDGETPFYVACSKGFMSIAKNMLESGAKVDGNGGKKLPLNAACGNKHVSVVQLLLTNGANPNAQEEGNEDRYHCSLPLHTASADGNSELVELLLKHGANSDVADVGGNTALHHAVEHYKSRAPWSSRYPVSGVASKLVVDILLDNKADVNIVNSSGETPLYKSASRELVDVVSKMLQVYGGNPNKGSPDKSPLVAACLMRNVKLVDTLLQHGADPNLASTTCGPDSKHRHPLFIAVEKDDNDVMTSLLNAGVDVNAVNHEGKSVVSLTAENLTSSRCYLSTEEMRKKLSAIRLLLEHGANFNTLMPGGHSPLYLAVNALADSQRRGPCYTTCVAELLQLMVKHGAILQDSSYQPAEIRRQSLNSGTLAVLATFDGRHEFVVDMFRAGAGFHLLAHCCNAVATSSREAKSISLCQAAVLAGYVPTAGELEHLQLEAARNNEAGHLTQQLMHWLNEDRQQVPSLLRQCRVAIRRQLSVAVHFQTILPAVDKLPLPANLKLYLQFDGILTEVDLGVNKELQTQETTEETSTVDRRQLSPYDYTESSVRDLYDFICDYRYSAYDSDDDDYYYYGSDSDENRWW